MRWYVQETRETTLRGSKEKACENTWNQKNMLHHMVYYCSIVVVKM